MEKGDSKVAIVDSQPRSDASSRMLSFLAGAVALLAVSFIVLIACGTVVLNNNACDQVDSTKQQESSADVTQRYDLDYEAEEKTYNENVVMHPTRRMEYIVTRDAESGLVESVTTIDFNAKTTIVYSAKLNLCFMHREETRDFDDVIRELHKEEKNGDKTGQRKTVDFKPGAKVTNVNDIPVEMSAFCTTTNTRWLEERSEDERTKRQTVGWCFDCVYTGYIYTENGVEYYVYWCLWCITCVGCPCVNLTECFLDYGFYNGTHLIQG